MTRNDVQSKIVMQETQKQKVKKGRPCDNAHVFMRRNRPEKQIEDTHDSGGNPLFLTKQEPTDMTTRQRKMTN